VPRCIEKINNTDREGPSLHCTVALKRATTEESIAEIFPRKMNLDGKFGSSDRWGNRSGTMARCKLLSLLSHAYKLKMS